MILIRRNSIYYAELIVPEDVGSSIGKKIKEDRLKHEIKIKLPFPMV